MINKIISGISVAINSEFGDSYDIHTEDIEQGLTEPCFSILCLNPTIDQVLGKRYFRRNQFCIHYFPSTNEKRSECHNVMERLMGALQIITVDGDQCRGSAMRGEVVDDVLSFLVNYDMFVYQDEDERSMMQNIKRNIGVKGYK